jgi:beta-mannanase
VLWGAYPGTNNAAPYSLESAIGRNLDLVYHFKGIDSALPTKDEVALVNEGRLLHVNIEARSGETYADIIAGKYDASLQSQAKGFAALKAPVFITFDHEADAKTKYNVRGTPQQFVDAWRHVRDVYVKAGATNAVWVWVVTGSSGNNDRALALYPGNAYVDWISWDPYNHSGCMSGPVDPSKWKSFEQAISPFYNWLQTTGKAAGIDPNKPYMLSEFATAQDPNDLQKTADWYKPIPSVLAKYPKIKAVQYFNTYGNCDYKLTNDRRLMDAFRVAGLDSFIQIR